MCPHCGHRRAAAQRRAPCWDRALRGEFLAQQGSRGVSARFWARVCRMPSPSHVVAIVGGATAGAEAAGILADRGVLSVVFEQNQRPYGKIEDGLPRWHVKLRQK